MKFRWTIHGVPILILIDSGATHNFISKKLMGNVGWQVEEARTMLIKLGGGYKAVAHGKCNRARESN